MKKGFGRLDDFDINSITRTIESKAADYENMFQNQSQFSLSRMRGAVAQRLVDSEYDGMSADYYVYN